MSTSVTATPGVHGMILRAKCMVLSREMHGAISRVLPCTVVDG